MPPELAHSKSLWASEGQLDVTHERGRLAAELADERTSTGVGGLDRILTGGFPANRAILISGEPGTCKSTMGLQFLVEGILKGEPGICVSVDQKPHHLLHDAARFDWNLAAAVASEALTVLEASAYFTATRNKTKSAIPIDARNITTDLSNHVRRTGAKRLVIDGLHSLVPPDMTRAGAHDYLRSVLLSLEDNMGCTVLLTALPTVPGDPQAFCEALVSGIVVLSIRKAGWTYGRTLFVKKMRGTPIDPDEYTFQVNGDKGIYLLGRSWNGAE